MKQCQKGFTLIEMLIAMAIFSALITVLMLGYSQGLLMWGKGKQQSHVWLDYEFRYKLLDTLVSQAVVSDKECAKQVFSPYFLGSPHSMTFISSAPVMNVLGRVRFVMLKADHKADGHWRVRYRENRGQGGKWVMLLDGLRKVSFLFEAPIRAFPAGANIRWWSKKDKSLYRDKAEWLTDYDACKLRAYPQQLLIDFTDSNDKKHRWLFSPPQKPDAWSLEAYVVDE